MTVYYNEVAYRLNYYPKIKPAIAPTSTACTSVNIKAGLFERTKLASAPQMTANTIAVMILDMMFFHSTCFMWHVHNMWII